MKYIITYLIYEAIGLACTALAIATVCLLNMQPEYILEAIGFTFIASAIMTWCTYHKDTL